jgi:Tol biopolymer transport system component
MRSKIGAVLIATLFWALAVVAPAHAAFPGANGKIAYQGAGPDIHVMSPDGSNDQGLGSGTTPSWSPDGTKIAFADGGGLWVMNADGSLRHQVATANSDGVVVGITVDGQESHPTWSPDGAKIAFARSHCIEDPQHFCTSILDTINADGSGETTIVRGQNPNPLDPKWSPDGTKIAFSGTIYATNFCCADIYTVNPDGTGQAQLTNTPDTDDATVDWSPDGFQLVAVGDSGPYTMNRDGSAVTPVGPASGARDAWSPDRHEMVFESFEQSTLGHICTMGADGTNVNCLPAQGRAPDWQPIPYTGYPRPRGATPFLTYLVPAYKPCTAPSTSHGAPLSFQSCNPPQQASSYLTVGTPDANGAGARSIGFIKLRVKSSNPSSLLATGTITDVRCLPGTDASVCNSPNAADGPDYSGELQANAMIRISDRDNGPNGDQTATVIDIPFPVNFFCVNTTDTTTGGVCTIPTEQPLIPYPQSTTPPRAVVGITQFQVFDGGPDGNVSTNDNTVFMRQGIFVP